MARIVVCGGSVIGLSVAMMLAADGHQVTVLEADPAVAPTPPVAAWESWRRKGVAQFHQPHNLFTRFRRVCEDELPGLTELLAAGGCPTVDPLGALPPTLSDTTRRPGDHEMRYVTGRRPVVESVIAAAAVEHPGVTVRRGVRVAGLLAGASTIDGVPHASGVRTESGEEIVADLVVDAMGRRTPAERWLQALGARPPIVEARDRGFVYYTRYFTGPSRPPRRAAPLQPLGSVTLLTLEGDNDTWSVTLFGLTGDTPMKTLRDRDAFTRVVSACPGHAHWLDGTPLTDVLAMAGAMDRYRRFVVDGRPIVTGFAAVGDAWACTNPSAGRGLSIGIVHAQMLRRTVRKYLEDPALFAAEYDAATEREVAPYVREQLAADDVRIAEMEAARLGVDPPRRDSMTARLFAASAVDPDAFRAMIEIITCTALPREVLTRPGMVETIDKACADLPPFPPRGPDRNGLLELLAG
jgi:2-polyprenyl-6-methoxyphenol hydroxylase-like FAD-dependent oxidoreductase